MLNNNDKNPIERQSQPSCLGAVRRSLLYKNEEDVKYSVDIKTFPDGKLKLLFSADCGKFGTDEPLDEYELTVKEMLLILQKHDAVAYR
jgi:hypothetical protein